MSPIIMTVIAIVGGILIVFLISGLGGNSHLYSTRATSRTNDTYQPNPVSVEVGNSVIWTNNDFNIHTVTEGSPFLGRDSINTESEFDSDLFGPGNSFTHLFDKIGTYEYYCTLHPWMVDRVIVVTND